MPRPERHMDVLERFLEVTTHPSGPTTVQNDPPQRPHHHTNKKKQNRRPIKKVARTHPNRAVIT